jgi:hypothetical protein
MNWTDRIPDDAISYIPMSDPAPLPRLGEVFFDVRGNSRSMRLSWYADTGVAVFSIWQAGMCTGTFRLPMADLSRMIEILERGPAPRGRGRPPVSAPSRGADAGSESEWYYGPDADGPARSGPGSQAGYGAEHGVGYGAEHQADYGAEHGVGYGAERQADYGGPGYETGYGRGERGSADYGYGQGGGPRNGSEHDEPDFGRAGYGPSGRYPADYGATDEPSQGAGYGSAGQDRGGDDYRGAGYSADYGRGYEPAGHGSGGYGAEPDYRGPEYSGYADDRGAGADRGYLPGDYDDRQEFWSGTPNDGSDYHEDGFAAPYVGDGGPTYPHGNLTPGSGYQADIGDAAYPADRRPVSPSDRYLDEAAAAEEYSYGADYRYR